MPRLVPLSGYERLEGKIPVVYASGMEEQAQLCRRLLATGTKALSEMLGAEPPELEAVLVTDEDWDETPRADADAYPLGLPYFTRSVRPPTLVLPATLSPIFRPSTERTYPLVIWHELAHAFLLIGDVVRTPAWLREFVPQAASVAIAHRARLPLTEHLSQIEREPGLAVRGFRGRADAGQQMAFQNLLLLFGASAIREFGDGFLRRLVHALWEETNVVGEERAEELLAESLGPEGWTWLRSRPEF